MSALGYLFITRVKNRLKSLLKSPGSIISILLMVALLGFVIFSGNHTTAEVMEYRDMSELYAIVLAFYMIIFLMVVKNGLGKGTSLFKMPDVNLIFTSPITSRRILMYGMVQQLGTSLLMGFFLLFQYSWLRNLYGIDGWFLAALALGYGVVAYCGQLTAMVIYVNTSGNSKRKQVAMWTIVGISVVAVVYVLVHAIMNQGNLIAAAVSAANGLPLSLFPVAGWAREFVVGISTGNLTLIIGMVIAIIAYIAIMIAWMTHSQADYYEDVLQSTERSFSAVVAAKEGKQSEQLPENIKVGKTGIGRGHGASTFFYKQRLESRRARRFIMEPMQLIFFAMICVFAYFIRDVGILGILVFSTYMQFFTASAGRWVRELIYPYVYLAPDSPFKKLIFCILGGIERQAIEAVLLAVALMLIMSLSPIEAVAFALIRLSFGVLFTAGIILSERMFGGVRLKWLVMIIVLFTELIMSIPGIALTVWVSIAFPTFLTETLRILLVPIIPNLLVSLLAIFASRNVLVHVEFNSQ